MLATVLNMRPEGYATQPLVVAQYILDTFKITPILLWILGVIFGLLVLKLLYKFLRK